MSLPDHLVGHVHQYKPTLEKLKGDGETVTPDGARFLVSIPGGVTATEADDYRRVNVILNFFEELKELLPVP